ncbi:MAG: SH3 domain-containing protein [Oscillospiraceae bacterium]
MANILVDNIKPIYPLPDRVQARPTTAIGEVRRTKAPSVLAELGYHDNVDDANWLTGNLDAIAQALSIGVTEYFGLPFLIPGEIRDGKVATNGSSLNLRGLPSTDGAVLTQMPNGASVRILAEYNDWYSIFMTASTALPSVSTLPSSPLCRAAASECRLPPSPGPCRRRGRRGRPLLRASQSRS